MFNYPLYKIGQFISRAVPLKTAYKIAAFFSDVHFVFADKDRAEVIANLKAMFPEKSKKELLKIRIQIFRNFAKYLVDFFRSEEVDTEYIKRKVKIDDIRNIDDALKKGKGVVILSAHIGNWELGGIVLAYLGYPLSGVALPHKSKKVNDFFNGQREKKGMKVISFGKAARTCLKLLKENKLIALVGDKDFSKEAGVVTNFFGKPSFMPKGPAAFALKNGSAIVPVFVLRNPDDTFTIKINKPIDCSSNSIEGITAKCTEEIEKLIIAHPEQWYMFKKFWIQPKL
ncbi:MAG: lysophospholipid acyltransferase family protein [Candidatus Omnitrophica bacterium]|nr:lysophospholipid acyltransferase family protein [Candidatus Omnitrophota bacterium]